MAIDAGGTMTDTFIVDRDGQFTVGKAQTTPHDEALGFMESSRDALGYWDLEPEAAFPKLVGGIYSGTSMLNRLLERKGRRVGLLVTKGTEDSLRMERAAQTHLNMSFADRLHVVTHAHHEPIIPREDIRGVPERIDVFGNVVIPLYEPETRSAIEDLLDRGVEALVVNCLQSFRNPVHEQRIKAIAEEVLAERRREDVPVFISSEYYPVLRDFPRLNTIAIEAYAADPSRDQLRRVQEETRKHGANFDLRIIASHGATISIESKELARTLVSGPIGGVVGARALAETLGISNVVATDIGGTSFDLATITAGEFEKKTHPQVAHYLLAIPMIGINSVGAGTGSFVRIDPTYGRIEIGPDSAGSRIGVSWVDGAVETVTVTDCAVVTGLVNPDYFLGGQLTLDVGRAEKAVGEQVADKLGIGVCEAAAGVISLLETNLRNQTESLVYGKGYAPINYTLFSYGGGGPLHVAGYAGHSGYADVIVPAWAAGFSAYGCAAADYEYRYDASIPAVVPPGADPEAKIAAGAILNAAWATLRDKVEAEFAKSGIDAARVTYRNFLRVQYLGQLNDLEVFANVTTIEEPSDIDRILARFEEEYRKVYARSASSPEFGYALTTAIVRGTTDVAKPKLPVEAVIDGVDDGHALKGTRDVFWTDAWVSTRIFEMDEVAPGQLIDGPAIVEAPATTLAVPPGFSVELDAHRLFHLKKLPQEAAPV